MNNAGLCLLTVLYKFVFYVNAFFNNIIFDILYNNEMQIVLHICRNEFPPKTGWGTNLPLECDRVTAYIFNCTVQHQLSRSEMKYQFVSKIARKFSLSKSYENLTLLLAVTVLVTRHLHKNQADILTYQTLDRSNQLLDTTLYHEHTG